MRRHILVAAGAFALAAALPITAQAQAVRGVSDTEIIIGTYTDLSGVTVAWGVNNSNAIRMVFDDVNAKGGIHGRKIRYIVEDNQYQVPRSIQAANKLINRDNVFLMIANGGTPMNNAVMPDQLAKGVPNIFPLTSARSMHEPFHKMKFALVSSYYDQMRAAVKYLVETQGKKSICAMYQDTDFGRDIMDGVRAQLDAMKLKNARRIGAVAVVDGAGRIIGNFSVSEMRTISESWLWGACEEGCVRVWVGGSGSVCAGPSQLTHTHTPTRTPQNIIIITQKWPSTSAASRCRSASSSRSSTAPSTPATRAWCA